MRPSDPLEVSDRVVALAFRYEPLLPHLRHRLCGGTGMRPTGQGGLPERCGCDAGRSACTNCGSEADRAARALVVAREPDDVIVRKAGATRCPEHQEGQHG